MVLTQENDYNPEIGFKAVTQLNEYFEDGWEYVESISQSIATGTTSTRYGKVIVILRKQDKVML